MVQASPLHNQDFLLWSELMVRERVRAVEKTANYSLSAADIHPRTGYDTFKMNVATANTFTVQPNATVPIAKGQTIVVYNKGAGLCTITPGSGVTIRNNSSALPQYGAAVLWKEDTDIWVSANDETFAAIALSGLTGATTASRYVGATASGAPTSGTFLTGDWIITADGQVWICTSGGTQGTWQRAGGDLVNVYTSGSTTWTKPTWARTAEIWLIGAGGGGGSGRKGAASTIRCGGGGGGSGGMTHAVFSASDLPSTVNVTVGAVGTGGAAQATNSTNGNTGGTGGTTYFGASNAAAYLAAAGGTGGGGGTATAGTAGQGGSAMFSGSAGATASATGGVGAAATATSFTAGGAAGGGITSANVSGAGGVGAPPNSMVGVTPPTGGVVGGAAPTAGANPNAATATAIGGTSGGSGAASQTSTAAQTGATGGIGAGGSGGGAALDTTTPNSGAGGAGGIGFAVVISRP